jgi:large subunit ribosomal protein L1
MGKIRIKTLGDEEREKKQKAKDEARREAKKIAKQKSEEIKVVAVEVENEKQKEEKKEKKIVKQQAKRRSKSYQKARSFIDKTKLYSFEEALGIVKKASRTKFDSSVELHINTTEKGLKGSVVLPHKTGKQLRVAVVDDRLLAEIENGKISFDVLISHPSFMPKLAKLAKILGPKGLMPNPKNGTISEKPEETAKKYTGTLQYKTESDFPIIHSIIGKTSFEDKKLLDNFNVFIKTIDPLKIKSVFLKTTMSPSIKISFS